MHELNFPVGETASQQERGEEPEGQLNEGSAPAVEDAFPLIQSWPEIEENLRRLQAYLHSSSEGEREFARRLLRLAKCVVLSHRGGQLLAGPSRFAGYAGMTRERFQAHVDKDGRQTNVAISSVLRQDPIEDTNRETEYQEFCARHEVQVGGQSRKYWLVQ
jgi:hypothetical protein